MRSVISLYSMTIAFLAATVLWAPDAALAQRQPAKATAARANAGSPEGAKCLQCHKPMNPALAAEWHDSAHGQKGITCYDCHKANKGDPGAFEHNGSTIHVIVSPKDCGTCHQKEVDQQKGSHHAKAGEILASLDNFLGSVLGGPPAVAVGCLQCHGSTVKVLPNGKFDPATWPNTGIGRINPDGSAGSCSACHTRHSFSKAQAREPQTCGKCHLGPDHPQMEIYQESKHGILWDVSKGRLNLDKSPWRAGVEYTAAPSCASCHMGATRTQGVTHDVGERISWTLRPPVSTKLNMVVFADLSKEDRPEGAALPKVGDEVKGKDGVTRKVQEILTWQQRREKMQDVCTACHASGQVSGFYQQFDGAVLLYNEKFYKANKLTAAPMDEKLEWTYYELWHHQGRRARHGASMSGPDYAWWHGFYEVAKSFYTEFLPEVKQVAGEQMANELMEKYVYTQPGHLWLKEGMNKEQLQKIEEFYRSRYGDQGDKK
jgi:hypothetical protein